MKQQPLFDGAKRGPSRFDGQKILAAYGGGVNTIAMLVWMRENGVTPWAIVMANPGSEREATLRYRDEVMAPWLAQAGFPEVVVVSRWEEGPLRKGFLNKETLEECCERTKSLPSIAYGWKKCSYNYKAAPSMWWTERQSWAQEEWAAERKIVKAIGYDFDEDSRAKDEFNDPVENRRYQPWYPLRDAQLDREDCVALIRSAGLPVPTKSSCSFCPNNTLEEWEELRRDEPEAFERALVMSRRAAPDLTSESAGLMRCNPHGKRQLHVWHEGGYDGLTPVASQEMNETLSLPCECAV